MGRWGPDCCVDCLAQLLPVCSPLQSDPFVKLSIGKKKIDDQDNYIPNNLNPIFGRYVLSVCCIKRVMMIH